MGEKELDLEWVALIKEALLEGITKEEIREYLETKNLPEYKMAYK
ncbi:DNA-binding transcriptional MerR regulator [Bacillus pakistanensis]|uniref:DNA-binding transcriptional MerR regulator n=1 Tax=Rossellomorea pakistanensis TaxID=992288 RepID=A0ABS2NBU7_9BACI|nr:DNA-binding transcriptional MerR regulator [Bacillus pakistanensis]